MLVSIQVRDDVALKVAFEHRATGLHRDESLIIRCLCVLSVSLLILVIDITLFISVSLDDYRLYWHLQTRQHRPPSSDASQLARSARAQRRRCRSDH